MGDDPIRTCVACRARRSQKELLAVVSGPRGLWVGAGVGDRTGRPLGRGAYVCPQRTCVERACRTGALRRALRHEGALPEAVHAELLARLGVPHEL